MNRLSINLLPPELDVHRKLKQKFVRINKIGLSLLVIVSALTISVLIFNLVQLFLIRDNQQQTILDTSKLDSLRTQEELVAKLKSRLGSINNISAQQSKAVTNYKLFNSMMVSGVQITAINLTQDKTVAVSGTASSTEVAKLYFANLTDPQKNQNLINKVQVSSLTSPGLGGTLRFELTVTMN